MSNNNPNYDLPPLRAATVVAALRTLRDDLEAGNIPAVRYLLDHLTEEFDLDAAIVEWRCQQFERGNHVVNQ